MKRPTAASLKKVTPENLVGLGPERLAEILLDLAATRPELKRRLRMELAAEQGAEHLVVEIDKRLAALEAARGRISWRARPTFVRDLDVLRDLITARLGGLDREGALGRLWAFLALYRRTAGRMRDRDGALEAVFETAAGDLGGFLDARRSLAFVEAVAADPSAWAEWTAFTLKTAPPDFPAAALPLALAARTARPGWNTVIRALADGAGDIESFRSTFSEEALRDPEIAAELARRLMAAGRTAEAGAALEQARARPSGWLAGRAKAPPIDPAWESAWIEYLELSGQGGDAQTARWTAFERTLSVPALRDFTRRLAGFDDVEAETKAFAYAAEHRNFEAGLGFLVEWPALADAARMIEARAEEAAVASDKAELWAGKLRARFPKAAHILLRKSAAAAFRRRDLAIAERLTQEADSIDV